MGWISELQRRISHRLHGEIFNRDLKEEMQLHMDLLAEKNQANGMKSDEAHFAARRQFGNDTLLREISHEAWGWRILDTLRQDLRYAMRGFLANPGFTATALLSLVLGIGANTAIFSIINAMMLRTLPVEDPNQLVSINYPNDRSTSYTNPIWEQIRDHQTAFNGVIAYCGNRFDLSAGGERQMIRGGWVSGDFFRVLGVPALRGRTITVEDDKRGGGSSGPVVVISYNFWQRHFAGAENAIGQSITLDRHPFTIIGVLPDWFNGIETDRFNDVWIPIGAEPIMHGERSYLDQRSTWWLQIIGRLPQGVTLKQAEARLKALAPEVHRATLPPKWSAQDQKDYLNSSFELQPLPTGFSETAFRYRTALITLMAIVGLVLLIACANIANLLLARGLARQHEFSVRLAIGATRARVIRQLMTESILLSFVGAIGGLLVAMGLSRLLLRLISTGRNAVEVNLSLDFNLLAFTAGIAVLTAIFVGMVPAYRTTRVDVNEVLKDSSACGRKTGSRFQIGKALVTGQVAISLLLLVGAALFVRTLRNLLTMDTGYRTDNVLVVYADGDQANIPQPQIRDTYKGILDRMQSLPGIESASMSEIVPIGEIQWNEFAYPEGYVPKSRTDSLIYMNRVSPEYFKTLGISLLRGRLFDAQDHPNSQKVMVITEYTAKSFFGNADPIGKTISLDHPKEPDKKDAFQVIGVVKDIKYVRLNETPKKVGFVASTQPIGDPGMWMYYEVRTSGSIGGLVSPIRSIFRETTSGISLEFRNFETQIRDSLVQPRIVAMLSLIFGTVALFLSAVGLYGVTAYSVTQRKGEIGIRMALGAKPQSVVWLVLRDVLLLLTAGTIVGLCAALVTGRFVASLLYGIQANDPIQLAMAAGILAFATVVAAAVPACRASRLNPISVLREV